MKKAAYYARVSSDNQKDEATIESQKDEIERKIKDDGNTLSPNHIFIDDGWSGELLARPSLDRLRDTARKKEFDVLYVYDRGRLARKFSYQEIILEEISELEIEFTTLHDVKAETAEEKVLQSMQGVFHEYERVKIAERFRRGKLFKTRSGKLLGYNPVYGYDYVHKLEKRNGYFVINEDEAKVVLMIFTWIGEKGYTIRKVIKKLYELKIYPKKKKREFWVRSVFSRMLRDKTYTGEHYYNKSQSVIPKKPLNNGKYKKIKKSSRATRPKEEWILFDKVPVIISKELFEKAQKQLKLNSKFCSRNMKHNYLLNGLVYCTCGYSRAGQPGGSHHYYRCTDRIYNFPIPPKCNEKHLNAEAFDNIVFKKMVNFLGNEKAIKKQADRFISPENKTNIINQSQINELEKKMTKLDEEEQRYLKLYGSGIIISVEALEKQIQDVKQRKDSIQIQINELKSEYENSNDYSKLDIGKICKAAVMAVTKYSFEEKRNLLRKIVKRIVANQQFAVVSGSIPVESENQNVVLQFERWYSRTSKRRKIDAI